jgi:hypothetical protein
MPSTQLEPPPQPASAALASARKVTRERDEGATREAARIDEYVDEGRMEPPRRGRIRHLAAAPSSRQRSPRARRSTRLRSVGMR